MLKIKKLLTRARMSEVRKICENNSVNIDDIIEMVDYHNELIDRRDYRKAAAIEYGLYTIYMRTSSVYIKQGIICAVVDINRKIKEVTKNGRGKKRYH